MMRIQFGLAWMKPGKPLKGAFKQAASFTLFDEYRERISKFTPCEASGIELASAGKAAFVRGPGSRVWMCDRGAASRILSSEELAEQLRKTLDSGTKNLTIVVGGSDGFTTQDFELLKPELRWSFGKFTLPHELAAVIAAEQLYRGWTILRGLPYHSGH